MNGPGGIFDLLFDLMILAAFGIFVYLVAKNTNDE